MIPAIFDPDAMSEFLEAVRYYEAARPGLGRRFRDEFYPPLRKSRVANPLRAQR